MILDYNFDRRAGEFNISYITPTGAKQLQQYRISKFPSFREVPDGEYTNWNGAKCTKVFTDRPCSFDYLRFIRSMGGTEAEQLGARANPRMYTWDIETKFDPDEFPDPHEAKFPITVISIASDKMDVVELGTEDLTKDDQVWVTDQIREYIKGSQFYRSLNLPEPRFQYIKFPSEEEMLKYFLTSIARKAPVLAGWNSDGFDSLYIQTRMSSAYPKLRMQMASPTSSCTPRRMWDMRGNQYTLWKPDHTLMLDMMDVVENYDLSMGNKESMSLDYIARKAVGIGKIEYDGDLEDLRHNDYRRYVFYSCIDSILVQLISQKLRTMNNMYAQALYCGTRIGDVFSKIKATEALMFNYWFKNGIQVCPVDVGSRGARGELIGAYVRTPTPGKHEWVCCNDFASLYPSTIRTCNISFENYVGCLDDGDFPASFLVEAQKDPKYFVTINNCVYKNDKIYAFAAVQGELYDNRNKAKYLSKQLDATIGSDIEHIKAGRKPQHTGDYPENVRECLKGMGYQISGPGDLTTEVDINKLAYDLGLEIDHLSSFEQGQKLLGNSGYGASSHQAFAFFNIRVANSITLSGQELIHLMEDHIPRYFADNWYDMTDLHKKLGIKVTRKPGIVPVLPIAGDTDSIYSSWAGIIKTISHEDSSPLSDDEVLDFIIRLNTEFLDQHNEDIMREFYGARHAIQMVHRFELETIAYKDIRLDVKKRYAQLIAWKEGKRYDWDSLKFKSKGLEVIKASYPELARKQLTEALTVLLDTDKTGTPLVHKMNQLAQQHKQVWMTCPVEDICENKGVNNYTKYILDDKAVGGVEIAPRCPYHVRALANRNWTIFTKDEPGEPLYGGKMKVYIAQSTGTIQQYFAFMAGEYPEWADKWWPADREACFQKFYLDPLNRILEAIGEVPLNNTGYIATTLFDL